MKRVIICEDDPLLAIELADEVERAGSEVCGIFHNSFDALRAAVVLKPEIAIIDLNLADGDTGVLLATHLADSGCRVIVVSGSTAAQPGLGRISHAYIAKPIPAGAIRQLAGTRSA